MVNLHFLGLMEALLECRSTVLAKLTPLWIPVLSAYRGAGLPDHVRVRLQAIEAYAPPKDMPLEAATATAAVASEEQQGATAADDQAALGKWLQRLQFKMGQIEMQASNVTQFFTV